MREWEWECVAADFFVALVLCVLEVLAEPDVVFFFCADGDVDDDVLSCPSTASPGTISVQAKVATKRRLPNITPCSVARLPPLAQIVSLTERIPRLP